MIIKYNIIYVCVCNRTHTYASHITLILEQIQQLLLSQLYLRIHESSNASQ